MRNNLVFLICFFLCVSCAQHYEYDSSQKPIKIHYQELKFPEWFVRFPQDENYSIGLAYKTNDESMLQEAKESAAIFYSRNKASINIKKYAGNYDSKASFELIVSTEPEQLREIANSLQLVDSFFINHYFIALFRLSNADSGYSKTKNYISNQTLPYPNWYEKDEIYFEHDAIYSVAGESASDLIKAWKYASEKALLQIADFVSKEVQAKQLMIDERNYKFISIESATILDNIKPKQFFVSTKIKDSLPSYTVFIELSIQ